MQDELVVITEESQTEFNEILHACQRLCYVTRSRDLQVAAREQALSLLKKLGALKDDAVARSEEDSANLVLSLECTIQALISELGMWIALKDGNPDAAWDHLVLAQTSAREALAAHAMAASIGLNNYLRKLQIWEQFVFPPQAFTSVGVIIRRAKCTICQLDYGTCDHVAGRPYMGEICVRDVVEADLQEISLVHEPANKMCRLLSITDDDGIMRNVMTWLPDTSPSPFDA